MQASCWKEGAGVLWCHFAPIIPSPFDHLVIDYMMWKVRLCCDIVLLYISTSKLD
jgi:hypothetical protein